MEYSSVNEWLSLGANFGVLVGIIFLIVEIRQNTASHKSDSRKAIHTNDQASLLVALDNQDLFTKLGATETLSPADQNRLSFIFALDLRNREFEYFQYKSGSLDEATWQSYKDLILMNHATERGRTWWYKVGRDIVNPKFGELVDTMLEENPENSDWELFGNWDEGLSVEQENITAG
ncbi:MAG: hypothetical protein AB8B95_12780 [Pseudohongiellaceae bacterium]